MPSDPPSPPPSSDSPANRLERIERALEAASMGAWDWNLATGEVAWSPSLERLHGFEPGSFGGSFEIYQSHIHPDDREAVLDAISASVERDAPYRVEYRMERPDGSMHWVAARGTVLREDSGRPFRMVGICADISEQKRLEELFAAAEDSSRFLNEASELLVASLDYETTLRSLAALAVPRLADWCAIDIAQEDGYRRLAVAHRDPAKVEFARDLQRRYPPDPDTDIVGQVIRSGEASVAWEVEPSDLEGYARDADHLRLIQAIGIRSWMVLPLQARGRVLGAISFVGAEEHRRFDERDLALARELARRASIAIDNARLYREAQEANRAKDEFLAILSHELRTPMTAILGWTRMLADGLVDEGSRETAIETILRAAVVQAQLIDDVLDMSRIGSGKMRLEATAVDLAAVARAALETVRPTAEAKGVSLEAAIEPVPEMHGDASRLQQIIWNFLSNAIKFTPRGGRVSLNVRQSGSEVEVRVEDTGQGIHPHFLPHVFDLFRQAESTSTRAHGGLGLGLAIVRHLVEMHGGRVSAWSEGESRGATFTATFPISAVVMAGSPDIRATREPAVVESRELPVLTGARVLVVDDQEDARNLVAAILTRCGAEVATAESVSEALHLFEQMRPNVLVSDIALPGEDGFSLIARLRARENGRRLCAVALTALGRSEDQHRILRAGFDDYLRKPVEPTLLATTVARVLARNQR